MFLIKYHPANRVRIFFYLYIVYRTGNLDIRVFFKLTILHRSSKSSITVIDSIHTGLSNTVPYQSFNRLILYYDISERSK